MLRLRYFESKLSVVSSFKITVLFTAVTFAGCQRIPDQSRVTKLDLVHIVHNIRCEFQEALRKNYTRKSWINQALVSTKYTFTSTINNNGDFGFTGFWPFRNARSSGHVDGIIKADYDKTRKGETVLNLQEKFLNIDQIDDCHESMRKRSYKYPIKGKIGVEDVVRKFYMTASIRGLKNYETYTRELEFTVKKTGSVNPQYFISPVPVQARTFDLSFIFAADRTDVHNVIVTLTPPSLKYIAGILRIPYPDPPTPTLKVQLVGGKDAMGNELPTQVMVVTTDKNKTKPLTGGEVPTYEAPRSQNGISGEERALQRGINNIDRQEDRFFREGLKDLLGR